MYYTYSKYCTYSKPLTEFVHGVQFRSWQRLGDPPAVFAARTSVSLAAAALWLDPPGARCHGPKRRGTTSASEAAGGVTLGKVTKVTRQWAVDQRVTPQLSLDHVESQLNHVTSCYIGVFSINSKLLVLSMILTVRCQERDMAVFNLSLARDAGVG